jgi:hypothetical protein
MVKKSWVVASSRLGDGDLVVGKKGIPDRRKDEGGRELDKPSISGILANVTLITFAMATWLLLHYNLPAKPSARRVYIWRKLKALGAVVLQNAIWVLPETVHTTEHFRWLVTEIQEINGEASLWRSSLVLGIPESGLIEKFNEQVDREFAALLNKLDRKGADLAEISRLYQQIAREDYFQSELGREVRERLLALRGRSQ